MKMCLEKPTIPEYRVLENVATPRVLRELSEHEIKTFTQGEFDKYWKLFIVLG